MLSTPFVTFYLIGQIFEANLLALIKMFLLTCLYAVVHTMGSLLFYGELKNVFPLSIYLATKMWFYITWFIFFMPVVSGMKNFIFLLCSGVLWYCFLKAWKGDPGVITATEEDRIKVRSKIIGLFGKSFPFFPTESLIVFFHSQLYT
jgi:palmitoyltransferase ZDHHC13/17